ncbi:MAG: HDOD domain-containing protein [Sandaracinus sp.]
MPLAATRAGLRPTRPEEDLPEGSGARAGLMLGSYRLVTELGQGGMGTVYYAEHVSLPRRAAVKVLAPDVARDADLVRRFFDEAHAVNAIRHPGIVDVIDLGSEHGLHYLVMELLEGETLGARLERVGKLGARECVDLCAQAAGALAAAHEKRIVHRDLKPENLFLVAAGARSQVKVLDFGIAKLAGKDDAHRTRTGLVLGTPMYMSPEQCLGDRDLDARSDVYSLGVVAYEMLAGRPPFDFDAVGRLIVAHTHEPPPPPSRWVKGVPAALEQVVLRMLAKRREDRFDTMQDAARALDDALHDRVAPHLAYVRRAAGEAPTAEDIERIEVAQTRSVGTRLRDIVQQRMQSDRLPLPSLPNVVLKALDLLRNEGVGMARIARIVEADPILVARILRLANSVAIGATTQVTSLDVALARVGERQLRMLLHECAAREVFVSRDPSIARTFQSIWEHCLAVGTLARELADEPAQMREELYLAGLLHDVGKPVVGALLLETERSLWEKLGTPCMGGSLWLRIVDDCHAEVGSSVARRWSLPENVAAAIGSGLDHDPEGLSRFQGWLVYAHRLALSVGHRGGAPESVGIEEAVTRAREAIGATPVQEQRALAVLADAVGGPRPAPKASAAATATRAVRKR